MKIKIVAVLAVVMLFGIFNVSLSPISAQNKGSPECRVKVPTSEIDARRSLRPTKEDHSDTLGILRVLVVRVGFPDIDTSSLTKEELESAVFTGKYSLNSYVKEVSENRAEITGKVLDGWYVMPENASYYGYDGDQDLYDFVVNGVIPIIDPEVDFNDFDRVILVLSGKWSGYGSIGKWTCRTDDGDDLKISWARINSSDISDQTTYYV
ncbi:MAG: hypothetical protein AAB874_07665, partial [Patescibacteria group bacterium]